MYYIDLPYLKIEEAQNAQKVVSVNNVDDDLVVVAGGLQEG